MTFKWIVEANSPDQLSKETKSKVFNFIKFLRGRKSHYSLKDTSRVYQSGELYKAKLHKICNESNKEHKFGLTTFRENFDGKFNISFGYSHKYTCTIMCFLHYAVHTIKRFEPVKVVFLIRGHSYMEGEDKDMSLISPKLYTETPDDWRGVLRNRKPHV